MTKAPVKSGERFTYEFALPDPGTYFFHPHNALQLDRGLYAPLIVEDPNTPRRDPGRGTRRRESGPVDAALPQHVPPRAGDGDSPVVPSITQSKKQLHSAIGPGARPELWSAT